jgi:hypothetical protein
MIDRYCQKNKIPKSSAQLYKKAIKYCVAVTDVELMIKIFTCLIVISNTPKVTKETIKCEQYLQLLFENKKGEIPVDFHIDISKVWVEDIIKNVSKVQMKLSKVPNHHYFPRMVKYLKYLGRLVCLWSQMLPSKVGSKKLSASSNIVESFFSFLKNTAMNGVIHRCDDFIKMFNRNVIAEFSNKDSKYCNKNYTHPQIRIFCRFHASN